MPIWQTPRWSVSGSSRKKSLETPRPEPNNHEDPSIDVIPEEPYFSPDSNDPLETIRQILSTTTQESNEISPRTPFEEPVEDIHIDFHDLTLQEYLSKLRQQTSSNIPIEEFNYDTEATAYNEIQSAVKSSEQLLQSMDSFLITIQQDLRSVSGEIQALQDRSINLSRHLQNRKAVDQLLGPVIDDIVISPATIMRLSESDINDAWLKDLDEVERKIDLLNVGRYRKVAAVNEVHPYLEKLQIKIIERTRNFIVDLIKAIRFPDANLSSLQQLSFLRCTRPFSFLKRHNEQLATELGQAYVNTLRWYYTSHFERFSKILSKLQYRLLDRSEVLAKDTRVSRGGLFAAAAALTKPLISEEPFQLGDRIKILTSQESNIINSHMAEDTKRYFHLETIFNSFNYVLIDNASAEYLFLVEFFGYSNDRTSSIFQEIFQPSFNIGMNLISTFISENTDVHGLLLCIRLTQAYAFELQRRRIPVLENYINAILIHLWPRFQRAMDTHGESLRKNGATMKPFQNNESDTVPHPLTQQFAQFLQGILSLETIDAENEPINSSIIRLISDFEASLNKIASSISQKELRDSFMFRNYAYISKILSDDEGKLVRRKKTYFDKLLGMYKGY